MKLSLNIRWREEIEGLGFIGLLWLIFFGRILSGRYVYFLDDLKILYYPLEIAYQSFQAAWQLPLWSPLFGFGQPLLAWGQLGFFTPLHVILRAFSVDPLNLLQISVVAYFALGLFGLYMLLRQHTLSQWAASLGATVYTFSGFNIGHLNHVNFYVGTMVLPWLLIAITSFLRRPTFPRAATMTLAAGAIAMSAQPQVTLYIFCLAAIFGLIIYFSTWSASAASLVLKKTALTILATVMAILVSSLAILPLKEFIPETERGADLPVEELLDFSYPPSHAITLIAPYFFGDHNQYWGAKGFQELAAFTGIIPLLLAAAATGSWREYKALRLFGSILVVISFIMALGQYSPLYTYLVTNHILTTLNIPGRFVFFFTTGIAVLSAVGLHDLSRQVASRRSWARPALSIAVVGLLLTPFALRLKEPVIAAHAREFITHLDSSVALAAGGVVAYLLVWYLRIKDVRADRLILGLTIVAGGTLLIMAYNYTPVTTRASFKNSLAFTEPLAAYQDKNNLPGRLYSGTVLLNSSPARKVVATQPLSPTYSMYQPVTVTNPDTPCFTIPMQAATTAGQVDISLLPSVHASPLATVSISAHRTISKDEQRICFPVTLPSVPIEAVLRFTSETQTTIRLSIHPWESPSVYLVRVANPSPEVIDASQKSHRIEFLQDLSSQYDTEALLLARHLQVAGQASSARWVGALSIKPYREFIDGFLANDLDNPFTGDGEHIIAANRTIVDMVGITHLAQILPPESEDHMPESGYVAVAEVKTGRRTYRLYENPAAYPKAWLVPRGVFAAAADETRNAMGQPEFNPRQLAYISGPNPPPPTELAAGTTSPVAELGSVHITSYEPTAVTATVTTAQDAWLLLSDSTTPQWHTFIDGRPAPHYIGNTFMKAAFVPAGQHAVSFVYRSPATEQAKKLTMIGLGLLLACYILPPLVYFLRRQASEHQKNKRH